MIWRHRFAVFVAFCTLLLIFAGGLVTTTGSGLAVPDWPLSFGQVFPRMEGGVLFEHGHRMVATTVGILVVILAAWTSRAEPRRSIRLLGWTMLGVVILQGVFGGMTVLLRLPPAVSIAHAGLAEIFFALTVVMAEKTSRRESLTVNRSGSSTNDSRLAINAFSAFTAIVVYAQILLGAVVRHFHAGLAIPTFPLANGRIIPELSSPLVAWQFAHRVGALAVGVMVFLTLVQVLKRKDERPDLVRPAIVLTALCIWQILLGGLTIWTFRATTPTTLHVASGAALWGTSVWLAVRARASATSAAAEPSLAGARA